MMNTDDSIRLTKCLNYVTVKHPITLWSMVIDDKRGKYAQAAVRMLLSARSHATVNFSAVIMELSEKPLTDETKEMLGIAGWKICTVKRLPLLKKTIKKFEDQFTKFQLWSMTELETVVYLDSDTYALGNIDSLLKIRIPKGKKIAAGRDFFDKKGGFVGTFNMGVALLHPRAEVYDEIMLHYNGTKPLKYVEHWAEQGFLNAMWGGTRAGYKGPPQWHELKFEENANLAVFKGKPGLWEKEKGKLRLLHYTMVKPWDAAKCASSPYADICEWWRQGRGLTPRAKEVLRKALALAAPPR
eukprot:TRINITY_DN3720_c0_g2_i1.p1 TRINITY_DN3720_c0_g2~~TRINITY_DN3720_c0_g2_i1.p1  ORF type:complete len:299 (+),score=121.44 TRINITY_DN3720_c0_g2_i1:166-1062(+)